MAGNSYIKLLNNINLKEYKGKLDQQVYEGLTGQLSDEQEQQMRYYLMRNALSIVETFPDLNHKPEGVDGFPLELFLSECEGNKQLKKVNSAPICELFDHIQRMEYGLKQVDTYYGPEFYDVLLISSILYTENELFNICEAVNSQKSPFRMDYFPCESNAYTTNMPMIMLTNFGVKYTIDD